MITSLWTASTGLTAQQVQIDVIANNLANVSTNGFKQARGIFADLLYKTVRQPGAQSSQTTQIPDGLQIGLGTTPVSTGPIFTQGSLPQTRCVTSSVGAWIDRIRMPWSSASARSAPASRVSGSVQTMTSTPS